MVCYEDMSKEEFILFEKELEIKNLKKSLLKLLLVTIKNNNIFIKFKFYLNYFFFLLFNILNKKFFFEKQYIENKINFIFNFMYKNKILNNINNNEIFNLVYRLHKKEKKLIIDNSVKNKIFKNKIIEI